MKVLLANYRYFESGGPERYLFSLQEALATRGHETVPFSVRYACNVPTTYERYFVPPLAGEEEVKFEQHTWTARSVAKTLARSFYSPEVKRAVVKLIADTRPDVAYILHYLRKLSPSLLVGIKEAGLPAVVRLSDFMMMCPEGHFLRDGKPCTLCLQDGFWPSVKYRCVHKSVLASMAHYFATMYHRFRGYWDLIDAFVVPSAFTLEMMQKAGWPRHLLHHIPSFVSPTFLAERHLPKSRGRGAYILCVSRCEAIKGIDLLVRAMARVKAELGSSCPSLVVVGDCHTPFGRKCESLVSELSLDNHVQFYGHAKANELVRLYREARFTVIPSRGYENMPNVLMESYASRTPVLGAGHGSLPLLIEEGATGRCFVPNDVEALARAMVAMWENPEWCERAGENARTVAMREFTPTRHLERLLALFDGLQGGTEDRPR